MILMGYIQTARLKKAEKKESLKRKVQSNAFYADMNREIRQTGEKRARGENLGKVAPAVMPSKPNLKKVTSFKPVTMFDKIGTVSKGEEKTLRGTMNMKLKQADRANESVARANRIDASELAIDLNHDLGQAERNRDWSLGKSKDTSLSKQEREQHLADAKKISEHISKAENELAKMNLKKDVAKLSEESLTRKRAEKPKSFLSRLLGI